MKKALYIGLIVILVIALGVSGVYVAEYVIDSTTQTRQNNELAQIVDEIKNAEATTVKTGADYAAGKTGDADEDEPEILPCYEEIHMRNTDTVGWISIDGTKLNYAVLQSSEEDANYYLYRDFYCADSSHGSIYASEWADVFEPSDNITIYGHNMKDGSMFACLHDYIDKSAWEKNPLIFFDTIYEYHTYKIFAVFKTSGTDGVGFAYHQVNDIDNEADFNEFIKTCKDLAFYDTGITPAYGDKIICLSTCEYTIDNGRLVVAAVRIS